MQLRMFILPASHDYNKQIQKKKGVQWFCRPHSRINCHLAKLFRTRAAD